MINSNAKQATIKRFTTLLDGGILPRASVSQIIEYYEAQLRNAPITVKNDCSITNKFKEAEIAEMENDEF